MEGEFREELADLLECPICNEIMIEIVLCRTGHSFCRKCGEALQQCALCMCPMFIKKAPAFEALVKRIFAWEIEKTERKNAETQTIVKPAEDFPGECSHVVQDTIKAVVKCPFQGCGKVGVGLQGLAIHLASSHSILPLRPCSHGGMVIVPLSLTLLTQKKCKVVQCFGQLLFIVNFDVDAKNLLMSVLVSGVSSEITLRKFFFDVLEDRTGSLSEVMPYLPSRSAERCLKVPLIRHKMSQKYHLRIRRLIQED